MAAIVSCIASDIIQISCKVSDVSLAVTNRGVPLSARRIEVISFSFRLFSDGRPVAPQGLRAPTRASTLSVTLYLTIFSHKQWLPLASLQQCN